MAILLALCSSVIWGIADFVAGIRSRRVPVLSVLAISQLAGLLLIAVILVVRHLPPQSPRVIFVGMLAGACSACALGAFYRALSVGKMSVVTPIAATNPIIPVTVGIVLGNRLVAGQWIGIPLAIVGVVLAVRGRAGGAGGATESGAGPAVLSSIFFGCQGVALFSISHDPVWATGMQVATCTAGLTIIIVLTRHSFGVTRTDLPPLILVGLFEIGAGLLLVIAYGHGPLSVVAVLGALSPVVTVLLAQTVLRERVTKLQGVGTVLALAGVLLIASRLG